MLTHCTEQWSLVQQPSQLMTANCPSASAMQSPQHGSQFIHMQCERVMMSVVCRNIKWRHLILLSQLKKQIIIGWHTDNTLLSDVAAHHPCAPILLLRSPSRPFSCCDGSNLGSNWRLIEWSVCGCGGGWRTEALLQSLIRFDGSSNVVWFKQQEVICSSLSINHS